MGTGGPESPPSAKSTFECEKKKAIFSYAGSSDRIKITHVRGQISDQTMRIKIIEIIDFSDTEFWGYFQGSYPMINDRLSSISSIHLAQTPKTSIPIFLKHNPSDYSWPCQSAEGMNEAGTLLEVSNLYVKNY